MKEGNLTKFCGIPFTADNPYNYFEAKRILGLAMSDLRKDKRLIRGLGLDASAPGRGAITDRGTSFVFDKLRFKQTGSDFGTEPYLILALVQEDIRAQILIPNRLFVKKRKLLLSSYDNFAALIREVTNEMESRLGDVDGYKPIFTLIQRHYPSQRSIPIVDGKIEFDMRAEFEDLAAKTKVKYQPFWLPAVYSIFSNKKSNIYVGIGAKFSYHYSPRVKSAAILDNVTDAWIATKPIVELIVD